jgi:hypothetical protein
MTRYDDQWKECGTAGPRLEVLQTEGNRDEYGALTWAPDWVATLVREAEEAGVYTTGIDGDARRWVAVNTDVYGYDADQDLAVVQVRQSRLTKYGRETRKDYHLLGHLESGAVFAHPVVSPRRSTRAAESPVATVRYCLTKVWRCEEDDLDDIVRQGDVALIPEIGLPEGAETLDETEIIIAGSHRLRAASLHRRGDDIYARGRMSMVHLGREHTTVRVSGGTRRISVGYRAPTWGFSAPTVD